MRNPDVIREVKQRYVRNHPDRVLATKKKWLADNRELRKMVCRASYLKRTFGITIEQYNEMFEEQGCRCLICRREAFGRRLAVDHDHKCCPGKKSCGKCIRGLLCRHCNVGLGSFRDSPILLQKAAEYLRAA